MQAINLSAATLQEFSDKVKELMEFTEEQRIPHALVWGLLSFVFTKVAGAMSYDNE
jgi:hypothetical protein